MPRCLNVNFRAKVMAKLANDPSESAAQIRTLFEDESLQLTTEEPARTTAAEARRLWRTRLRNTRITRKELPGLVQLVEALENMAGQKQVDQFALSSAEAAVTLFFESSDHAFLGYVLAPSANALAKTIAA